MSVCNSQVSGYSDYSLRNEVSRITILWCRDIFSHGKNALSHLFPLREDKDDALEVVISHGKDDFRLIHLALKAAGRATEGCR